MRTFWVIETVCQTCEGHGYYDHPYRGETECWTCDGSGAETYEEPVDMYENEADVRADYGNARHICKETIT